MPYFIPPKNRYGLCKRNFDLTEKDFTICKVKNRLG